MLGSASPRKPSVAMPSRSSDTPDLAGRVPFDGQPGVVRLHPLAVVLDVNQLLAAKLDGDGDTPRAGVDRVLDQLLDHRGRPLDDFAGRNLVREIAGKDLNATHV